MSDPLKHSELEDVLSAIRRLVSEERERPAPAGSAVAPDKLVLTPALRVREGAVPAAGSEAAMVHPAAQAASDPAPGPEPAGGDTRPATHGTDRAHRLRGEDSSDGGRDGGSDSDAEGVLFLHRPMSPTADAASGAAAEAEDAVTLEAKIAELEALVGPGTAPDPCDAVAAGDVGGAGAGDSAGDRSTPPEDMHTADAVEETVLDEATLREIVTEILREELQGELGARITRNVRKLVRHEIRRAIAEGRPD